MISQTAHFAEVFTRARDCIVTEDLSDACQRDLRASQGIALLAPLSKGMAKRQEKARRDDFRDPVTHRVCSAETLVLRAQNEHYKRMMAEIGNSRTVTPNEEGLLYNAAERGVLTRVPHCSKEEQTPVSYAEHMAVEQAKIDAMRARLRAEFQKERDAVPTTLARRLARWEKEFSLD